MATLVLQWQDSELGQRPYGLENLKYLTIWSSKEIFLSHKIELYSRNQSLLNTHTHMFTVVLVIRAKRWSQPKCPSKDAWIHKLWYIRTKEYYSAIKGDQVLIDTCYDMGELQTHYAK